jgi:hypothetical protein
MSPACMRVSRLYSATPEPTAITLSTIEAARSPTSHFESSVGSRYPVLTVVDPIPCAGAGFAVTVVSVMANIPPAEFLSALTQF